MGRRAGVQHDAGAGGRPRRRHGPGVGGPGARRTPGRARRHGVGRPARRLPKDGLRRGGRGGPRPRRRPAVEPGEAHRHPLAREASRWAVRSLGPAALVEHPLLEKWSRDVCAFEFMEGTSDIQRQHIVRSYLKGRARRGVATGAKEEP
ncbi:acyl-CoA dehydrogenase family protein [Micromonospora tarapacensis]|uniref:acyl-CoA dehydrogenase family protein n=1 Tax=Micromonospora tarapacensis TaxID=2835305 RepID=UPI0038B376AB